MLLKEFQGVPAAMAVLHKWFDADAIDHMVQEQPLFLVEDVEDAIASLNRFSYLQFPALIKQLSMSSTGQVYWRQLGYPEPQFSVLF